METGSYRPSQEKTLAEATAHVEAALGVPMQAPVANMRFFHTHNTLMGLADGALSGGDFRQSCRTCAGAPPLV